MVLKQYTCSLCGSGQMTHSFNASDYMTGDVFSIAVCPRCDIALTLPLLSPAQLKNYYGESYYGMRKSLSEILMNRARRKKVSRRCGNGTGKKALDVGCGNGSFLSFLKNNGWDVCGTELSPESHLISGAAVKEIHLRDVIDCRFPDKTFNLVTLWHSLEHMADARHCMSEIWRILDDDGLLIVEVPNRESWQSRLTKNNWFHLDVPRHVSHFNPKSIAVLLNLSGFSVLKINHFSFIYGIFGFTQSILNLFTKRKNLLFDFLNGKIKTSASGKHRASMRDAFVTGVLLPPALLCAIPLFFLESFLKRGSVITVYAKKR